MNEYNKRLENTLENLFLCKTDGFYEELRENLIDFQMVLDEKERAGDLCSVLFWGSNIQLQCEPNVLVLHWKIYLDKMHKDDFTLERKEKIINRLIQWGADKPLIDFLMIMYDEKTV